MNRIEQANFLIGAGRVWCILAAVIALPWCGLAQRSSNWRIYKAADGLSESYSTAVTVSPQGHVWVRHGESDPISWLDGYEIHHLPSPGNGNFRVYESRTGQIWTLYAGGLEEYKNGKWVQYPVHEIQTQLQTNLYYKVRPFPMLPGKQNRVLFLTPDRLMEFNALLDKTTELQSVSRTRLGRFIDLSEARDGGIWITGNNGLAKLPGPSRTWNVAALWREHIVPGDLHVQDLLRPSEDDDGGVTMIGESSDKNERVVVYFNGQTWEKRSIAGGKARQAWRGHDGIFWAETFNSLSRLEPNNQEVPEREGLLAGQFFDSAIEPKGVFWLATSEGLVRHSPLTWRTPSELGVINPIVHAIREDSSNRLWFANSSSLIQLYHGNWRTYDYPKDWDLSFQPTDALFCLPDGRVAIGANDGFLLFDPASGQFTLVHHPLKRSMKLIGQMPDGRLCVETFNPQGHPGNFHLELYDGRQFGLFLKPQPNWNLGTELDFCVATSGGDVWLGGNAGIGLWRDNKLRTFSRADGQAPNAAICLLPLPDGKIWCGGLGRIFEFDGKNWSVVRDGFDRVNALIRGRAGTIWVASSDGLYRYADGSWVENGIDEGLPSAAVYRVFEDQRGNLWAGTARGLSRYDPSSDIDPPRTYVYSANDQTEFSVDAPVTMILRGQDKWKFTPSDRLLYSYRLDNLKWSPFADETTVALGELGAGKHRFEARAMDRNLNIDKSEAAVFAFTVVLPWYMETRLIIVVFCGLVVALLLAALSVNRHLQLKRSYAAVEKIVAQRTRELEKANQALLHSQKMQALGTLAAGIAHDFNSLLSIIKGSAQIIEGNLDNQEKIQVRVNRIKTMVDQGAGIVKALLGFSRTTSKDLVLDDVNSVVEETLELLHDRFTHEVTIQCELTPSLPRVPCARDLLQQMLLNLILNAADAMGGHGLVMVRTGLTSCTPANLVLSPANGQDYAYVDVRDTGCGITQEVQSRIFEPFFTTKAFSSRRGTGLGLSMVYEFAKEQGFGLGLESVAGTGTTFTIFMPMPNGKPANGREA
ncbi:MAG: ATP-binding protein [Candidatus Omnitrophica bacterium]|nr:ATP-binding protein [Candidatus Omnitrophota bacterium]